MDGHEHPTTRLEKAWRGFDDPHPEIRREAEDVLTEIRWRHRDGAIRGAAPDALG
ncbi:hypothetical protein [Streptomyces sp. cmx-4-7]|uniref:hypothetical protein n=1 Tax=unclassified Streptomyces TaxID=2593676 RepID=UPI00397ED9BF